MKFKFKNWSFNKINLSCFLIILSSSYIKFTTSGSNNILEYSMSANGQMQQQQKQQLRQELQNELTSSNQLLKLISTELQIIKQLTSVGGEVEKNVLQNALLIETLANGQNIDLMKLTGPENCDQ